MSVYVYVESESLMLSAWWPGGLGNRAATPAWARWPSNISWLGLVDSLILRIRDGGAI